MLKTILYYLPAYLVGVICAICGYGVLENPLVFCMIMIPFCIVYTGVGEYIKAKTIYIFDSDQGTGDPILLSCSGENCQ